MWYIWRVFFFEFLQVPQKRPKTYYNQIEPFYIFKKILKG